MTEPTKPNENEEQRSAPEQTPPMQPIVDMGAVTTRTARGTVYCLTVIGQIEGHSLLPNTVKTTKYEHVLPLGSRRSTRARKSTACCCSSTPAAAMWRRGSPLPS